MSRIRPTELQCPECGHSWQATLFDSVNASRLLHVADQIIDGTFELEHCPECAHRLQPEHDLLYSDIARGLWVFMRPSAYRDGLEGAEAAVEEAFRAAFAGAPTLVGPHLEGARPRLVFGHRELRECLLIDRQGVPAALVECAKLRVIRELLAGLVQAGPVAVFFDGVVHDGADVRFELRRESDGGSAGRVHLPVTALYELAEQEAEYRARFPALFERPYVNIQRYLAPAR